MAKEGNEARPNATGIGHRKVCQEDADYCQDYESSIAVDSRGLLDNRVVEFKGANNCENALEDDVWDELFLVLAEEVLCWGMVLFGGVVFIALGEMWYAEWTVFFLFLEGGLNDKRSC